MLLMPRVPSHESVSKYSITTLSKFLSFLGANASVFLEGTVDMIKAVSFDFWDTLAVDNSDDRHRICLGLQDKKSLRVQLIFDEIQHHHSGISIEKILAAVNHVDAHCYDLWQTQWVTPTVTDRVTMVYRFLRCAVTAGFAHLIRQIETIELEVPPQPQEGAIEVVRGLALHYRLGILSDTIITPGRVIRQILQSWQIEGLFSVFAFSDEVGAAKPSPQVFRWVAQRFQKEVAEIVHIGDRETTDIAGAKGVGMRCVRLINSGVESEKTCEKTSKKSNPPTSAADAVCYDIRNLPNIIATL